MAIHSSILAWKTPTSWTEEHGRLQSLQLQSQTQWNYWACTITLQCCVGFCHTTQWISLKYTYVPSLPNLTTIPYPKKPFNHNTRDDHLYTLVCVCVCVCTPFWWLRRYRICLQWGYPGPISGLARSPGEGNYETVQYSCLENFMDRGAWWAIFHGVTQSWRWLNMCICIHINTHINMYIYAIYMLYVYICSVMFDFAKAIFCNIQ